jgi:transglutaminase-like putative cysteine protease
MTGTYEDTVHHRWVEFYLPGHGWFPVDGSRNDGEDGNPVNSYFGKIAPGLLVLLHGDGGSLAPLGWGYVTRATFKDGTKGSQVDSEKRFTWRIREVTHP